MKQQRNRSRFGQRGFFALGALLALLASSAGAQPVVLVSKGQPGSANGSSQTSVAPRNGASADGRYFVFLSQATNLVTGQIDANAQEDVFLYDRINDKVKLVSRSNLDPVPFDPRQTANGLCKDPVISRDGNWVAFASTATNLVTAQVDTGGTSDVFLWSTGDGSIQLVSHSTAGAAAAGNLPSDRPSLYGDGSFVAFQSQATNFLTPISFIDGNGFGGRDIFRYRASDGAIALVSHNNVLGFAGGNLDSFNPVINVTGTVAIAFTSLSQNLVPAQNDTATLTDVFVGNGGAIELMSHAFGLPGVGNAPSDSPSISDDGNFVAFHTFANNLILLDPSPVEKVVLADRSSGPPSTTTLVSHATGAPISANASSTNPLISGDGLWVAFQSGATNLVASQVDFNAAFDVFLFEVGPGTNQMVSHRAGILPADKVTVSSGASFNPEIDATGSRVAFVSTSQDLAPSQADTNGQSDVFVWDAGVDAATVASRKAGTAATTGGPGGAISDLPVLSGDGRFVAFKSAASDLVAGDTNALNDVFILEPTFTDVQVTKTSAGPAVPGAAFGYTVTVFNAGGVTVASATVSDPLPITLLSATWTCTATPGSSCTAGGTGDINDTVTLAPVGTLTYAITGTLALVPTFGTITNQATVTIPPAITDIDPSNDFALEFDVLAPNAVLTITHDDSPDPVFTNGTVTYVTRITNNGPSPTVELRLSVTIPGGATFLSVDNLSCSFAPFTVSCPSPSLADLAPGESIVVTIVIQAPNVPGPISSVATTESNTSSTVNATATTLVVDPASSFIELFTVTSTDSTNTLEWRTPPPPAAYDHTKIIFKVGGCPTSETDGTALAFVDPGVGAKGIAVHGSLVNGTTYCYAAFVARDALETMFSVAKLAKGRPFATSGPAQWAFSTGAAAVAPPGLGGSGVYVPSNDRILYSIGRGTSASGGLWLVNFTPVPFQQPVQSRPPVVPLTIGAATTVTFVTSQEGTAFAIDADRGDADPTNGSPDVIWASGLGAATQAAPAAWLQAFGGDADWAFVSTRAALNNSFLALDASSGFAILPNGGFGNLFMGAVSGGASVDYVNKRVYFTSRVGGDGKSVRCLPFITIPLAEGFGPPCWEATGLGDIDYGPVLRNGTVFVARNTGQVSALDAASGVVGWTFPGIGLPNGFPVVDRTNEDVYITAGGRVRALTHLVPTARWTVGTPTLPNPSQPLFARIGLIDYVFVGSSNGRLYQIDAASGTDIRFVVLGDGLAQIGAPSLDVANNLIYVGSDSGVVYAVQVPLP